MPALLAGLALLGLLLLFARGYTGAHPRSLARGLQLAGGVLLALLTVVLVITGRAAFGFLTAGAAWYLLFGSVPPWQRTSAGPGPTGSQQGRSAPPPRMGVMSRSEALKVLGLDEGATAEQIRASHRKLIQQLHPDKGGTNYLAAKINEAKDVLLRGR
jgi:hypothetical protein